MAELTARIESLEMRSAGPKRWYLQRDEHALLADVEWSWTIDASQAVRLPADEAEAWIAGSRCLEWPWLPTEPPKPPMFLRTVYGGNMPEEERPQLPAPPAIAPEVPGASTIPERIEAARQRKRVAAARPVSELDAHARWEAEHDQ